MVIMDEGGNTTFGVVEWNNTVTINCTRPETLSIRRNDEAQRRRIKKTSGIAMLAVAVMLCLLPVAVQDLAAVWVLAVFTGFCGVLTLASNHFAPLSIFAVIPGNAYELYWNGRKLAARQTN